MLSPSQFKNIVILTGAGISAESGITTFRDGGGLWEQYHLEDVATPEAFQRNPQLVWRFYSHRRLQASKAKPNLAHEALDHFMASRPAGHETFLITQNVDALHKRAHKLSQHDACCMHGSLEKSRCTFCGHIYYDDIAYYRENGSFAPTSTSMLSSQERANIDWLGHYPTRFEKEIPQSPCCHQDLRPHIVWFGEIPLEMNLITSHLQRCDLFVSIGTSGQVYPAAGFIEMAKRAGAKVCVLNKEAIPQNGLVDEFIAGSAVSIVPSFFKR